MKSKNWRRAIQVAVAVGPYVAAAFVLWRMATWEQAITKWVAHGQSVFDAASADLASKASDLHEDAVSKGAVMN